MIRLELLLLLNLGWQVAAKFCEKTVYGPDSWGEQKSIRTIYYCGYYFTCCYETLCCRTSEYWFTVALTVIGALFFFCLFYYNCTKRDTYRPRTLRFLRQPVSAGNPLNGPAQADPLCPIPLPWPDPAAVRPSPTAHDTVSMEREFDSLWRSYDTNPCAPPRVDAYIDLPPSYEDAMASSRQCRT